MSKTEPAPWRLRWRPLMWATINRTLRLVRPATVGPFLVGVISGMTKLAIWVYRFVHATDRADIRIAKADGPERHEKISKRRWYIFMATLALIALGLRWLAMHYPPWLVWPAVVGSCLAGFWVAGRGDRTIGPLPQFGRVDDERLVVAVTNEIVLTPALKKEEQTARVVLPVKEIRTGTGYSVRVGLPGLSAKAAILGKDDLFAAKMGTGESQIHLTPVKGHAGQFDLLHLYEDPWDAPPTTNPLVENPRPFDLWREPVPMGTAPTSEPYERQLVVPGGGGGSVIGAAPRMGKTTTANNILVPVLLDVHAIPICIDGKGVDWKPAEPMAMRYITRDDRQAALETLVMLVEEIDRRTQILEAMGLVHITEDACKNHGMPTLWLFLDEVSIYTEDAPTRVREAFLAALGTVMRLGPTFGIFAVLCSQRPTEKGIPPGIRDLAMTRIALYSLTAAASQAILGQGGDAARADRLDEDQKGVAIIRGVGQIRQHYTEIEGLRRVARYAQSLRAQAEPTGPTGGGARPPLIEMSLEAMALRGVTFLASADLLPALASADARYRTWDANKLAAAMREIGVSPVQATRAEHDRRPRGYRQADLEAVPPVVQPMLRVVRGASEQGAGTAEGEG